MGSLKMSSSELVSAIGPTIGPKLYAALANMTKPDYDSGWVPKPTTGVFPHGLAVLPGRVQVQGSDSRDGSSYLTEHPTSVTTQQIAVGGSKLYYRVTADRG